MIPRGIAKRYATALLNSAIGKGLAKEILDEIGSLRTVMSENPSLENFLLSPQVMMKDKKKLLDDTLKGRASDLLLNFLNLLIDKKRMPFIKEIFDAYTYFYERNEGIIEAKVVTAVPLDSETEQKVINTLEAEMKKKVRIVPVVDPKIIGGMVIMMEDKIIDGSVRFEMEKLKRELDEIRVEKL